MDLLDRVRAFTAERQRLGRAAPDAAAALRDVVTVYSSHPTAPLTLAARARDFSADGHRALAGWRIPGLRGSIFLVPPEDVATLFSISGGLDPGFERSTLRYYRMPPERYAELRAAVLTAAGDGPLTAAQLKRAVGTESRLNPVPSLLCREGRLLRIPHRSLRSNALSYQTAEVPRADPDASLARLADAYLRAFGPARVTDFAWWTGTTRARAEAVFATVNTIDVGDGLLLRAADEADFDRARPYRGLDLLPKWDVLTMGWAPDGRERFLDPAFRDRLYLPSGDGLGGVFADGIAVATWHMAEGIEWWDAPGPKLRAAAEAEAARLLALTKG